MTFNFPIHSDLLDLPDLDEIQYDDFIGKETLNCEYKEFTFNNAGLPLDENSAEYYCYTNKFEFNPYVITNLIQYFKQYLPKYISAFINSNIDGEFYIGVNDYGFVKGIPYCGNLPCDYLENEARKIITIYMKYLNDNKYYSFDFNKIIKFNFIKIKYIEQYSSVSDKNDKFLDYKNEKKKYEAIYNKILIEYNKWKLDYTFVTHKIIDLINNKSVRLMLIDYIKQHDCNNPAIKVLSIDENFLNFSCKTFGCTIQTCPPLGCNNIGNLKQDYNNIFYWITRWKDEMVPKVRSRKPIFNISFNSKNTPINLLTNCSTMVPYWMKLNTNMNLYLIKINIQGASERCSISNFVRDSLGIGKITNPKGFVNDKNKDFTIFPYTTTNNINHNILYYDLNTNNWLGCKRYVSLSGDPYCNKYIQYNQI